MRKNKASCKDVMSHICESLGEEINSPKCVAIKEHLDNCDGCKNYFKSVELTIDYYRKYRIKLSDKAEHRLLSVLNLDDE